MAVDLGYVAVDPQASASDEERIGQGAGVGSLGLEEDTIREELHTACQETQDQAEILVDQNVEEEADRNSRGKVAVAGTLEEAAGVVEVAVAEVAEMGLEKMTKELDVGHSNHVFQVSTLQKKKPCSSKRIKN